MSYRHFTALNNLKKFRSREELLAREPRVPIGALGVPYFDKGLTIVRSHRYMSSSQSGLELRPTKQRSRRFSGGMDADEE
jgi:hypothetical protein